VVSVKRAGVVLCVLAPHPPLLIPEIGKGDIRAVKATQEAMKELACRVNQAKPDVIIVISPHAPLFRDAIAVLVDDPLCGIFPLSVLPKPNTASGMILSLSQPSPTKPAR